MAGPLAAELRSLPPARGELIAWDPVTQKAAWRVNNPTVENGGLAKDGTSVTWKLKKGVTWHDGQPFTADDVVFTYQYVINKETAAVTAGNYTDLETVEAVDPTTVRLTFKQPTGGWFVPFTGYNGMTVPKPALADYIGSASSDAPFNQTTFDTGHHMTLDLKPRHVLQLLDHDFRSPAAVGTARHDLAQGREPRRETATHRNHQSWSANGLQAAAADG